MVCAMTVHRPILMSMSCPHVYYSSSICLPQGYHCYDLKLKLRLYLGKDLRVDKGLIGSGKA